MTDSEQSSKVETGRGEVQPWTDFTGDRHAAGGATLVALLDDLLPRRAARTLVAGPHTADVIELAAARSAHVTVIVRSVSDAQHLRTAVPAAHVTVIAGALDGLSGVQPFDVVLAADGLDRVLGYDSPGLNWPQRKAELVRLATADALMVVGVDNEFSLTGLYDRRPTDVRHGNDEWRPVHDDPARPTSVAQVAAEFNPTQLYAAFDAAGVLHTLLDVDAAALTRPGHPGANLAVGGFAAKAARMPLLAPIVDGADAAARAGLLGAIAPSWLAIRGPAGTTHTAYALAVAGVLVADLDEAGWTAGIRNGGLTEIFDPALVATHVPDVASVEGELFRLAAAEDVPGFRAYAARIGVWANDEGLIVFDDLFADGEGFIRGMLGYRAAPGNKSPDLLAAAWHRFRDRLLRAHRRHPWPPWVTEGDDLVSTWLGMSGVQVDAGILKCGREIADRIAEPSTAEPDVRTILADRDADKLKIKELAGKVFGLERTLRFRDQALRTREAQVRSTRDNLRELRNSPAMRLQEVTRKVSKIRHPRQFARAVKRRLLKS